MLEITAYLWDNYSIFAKGKKGMIRTILFDLDDTLLDFKASEAEALRYTLKTLGLEPTDEIVKRYSVINQAQWELLEKTELTRQQVLVRRFEILFQEYGIDCEAQTAQDMYHHRLSQGHYFIDGAIALLENLCKKYDLYVVSNGTGVVQDGRIKSAGIAHYFKDIFISERMGADKPDPVFFENCFKRIPGFKKEEAVIIGDSLTSDIRGGNRVCLRTVWFNPRHLPGKEGVFPDYEIAALAEIPALMERL